MASREQFLRQLWTEVIDSPMNEQWIDNVISQSNAEPDAPFSSIGPVLKRLLAAGAGRMDLARLLRYVSYEACFQTLYMLDDPGVDENEGGLLFESLLSADPSGKEGRA